MWFTMTRTCTNCGKEHPHKDLDWAQYNGPAWWHLNDAHGIWGYFCPDCYELVSHDPWGNPKHPKEFKTIAVKQRIQRSNKA